MLNFTRERTGKSTSANDFKFYLKEWWFFWVNLDFVSIYLLNYWGYKLQIFPQTSPHIYQNYGKVRFDHYPLVFSLSWNFWRNCFFLSLPFGFCYFSSNHHKNCKFGRNLIFFCWNSIYFSRGIWWRLHNWSISTHKKVIQAQSWERWSFWSQKKP